MTKYLLQTTKQKVIDFEGYKVPNDDYVEVTEDVALKAATSNGGFIVVLKGEDKPRPKKTTKKSAKKTTKKSSNKKSSKKKSTKK